MSDETDPNIGLHRIVFEPPDIIHYALVGDVSGPEMEQIVGRVNRFLHERKLVFSLLNLESLGSLSGGAKKLLRDFPFVNGGIAAFGTSVQMRVIVSLLHKAYLMFYRGNESPVVFFATEAEARGWIDDRRTSLEKK